MSDERRRFLQRRVEEEPGDTGAYSALCAELERAGERPRVLGELARPLGELRRRRAPRAVLGVRRGVDLRRLLVVYQPDVDGPDWRRGLVGPVSVAAATGLLEVEVVEFIAGTLRIWSDGGYAVSVRGVPGAELAPDSWVSLHDVGLETIASSVVRLPDGLQHAPAVVVR